MVIEKTAAEDKATENRRRSKTDIRQLLPKMGLKEYWYPAVEARKVKDKPVGRKLVGEDLVFFRDASGEIVALANVCPHRGGSLMHGDCHYPGTISCPYHGWTFDGEGNVLAVLPEGPESKVPGKVKARKYPTVNLKGMVFVWMGDGEPAPIEEDVPPEMFEEDTLVLFAEDSWPVNWLLMNENGGDAHAAYVHRDSVRALMFPLVQPGPGGYGTKTVNGRSTIVAGRSGPRQKRFYFPSLGWYWPKRQRRNLWTWMFRWAAQMQANSLRWECPEEWDTGHHLPSYTRINHRLYMHTRCAVPVAENELRNIYLKAMRPKTAIGKTFARFQWWIFGRWSQTTNFNGQDRRVVLTQRYDMPEFLSPTDVEVASWRRLITSSRDAQRRNEKLDVPELTQAEAAVHTAQRRDE